MNQCRAQTAGLAERLQPTFSSQAVFSVSLSSSMGTKERLPAGGDESETLEAWSLLDRSLLPGVGKPDAGWGGVEAVLRWSAALAGVGDTSPSIKAA